MVAPLSALTSRCSLRYDEARNAIVAARALRKGEEVTVDYFDYQQEGSYTFGHAASGFDQKYIDTVYP
jgi:hypothetical protein